jgi:hypothetical protein
MPGSKAVKERIEDLIAEASQLSGEHRQRAWLVAAQNAVHLACPMSSNPYSNNPYYVQAQNVLRQAQFEASVSSGVREMAATLERLLEEIEGGLLTTIENHAIAVTFDDFLDHGAEYLKHSRKDEAAVIAGIVFEDTMRRICRVLGVPENGVALDTLISELTKRDVLTALKAKRARAAAGLRTSAAHARWEEIQLSDVNPVIEFTRELMAAHLE